VPEFREGAIVTEHSDDIGLPERYRDSLWNIPTALAYKGILLLSTRIAYGLFLARLIARVANSANLVAIYANPMVAAVNANPMVVAVYANHII